MLQLYNHYTIYNTNIRPVVKNLPIVSLYWAEVRGVLWIPYRAAARVVVEYVVSLQGSGMLEEGVLTPIRGKRLAT